MSIDANFNSHNFSCVDALQIGFLGCNEKRYDGTGILFPNYEDKLVFGIVSLM